MVNKDNKRVSVKFTSEQYEFIEKLANKADVSLSYFINALVAFALAQIIKESK